MTVLLPVLHRFKIGACLAYLAQIAPTVWNIASQGIACRFYALQITHIAQGHRQGPFKIVALEAQAGQLYM